MSDAGQPFESAVAAQRSLTSPDPRVFLLPQQPYTTAGNEALPFRSTTYDAKYVNPTPFQRGSAYLQDYSDTAGASTAAERALDKVGLSQLYAIGYRSFLQKSRERDELGFHLPTTPPDFDGSTPTNPEAVAQHVHSLAAAYNSVHKDPTPFDMYHHVLLEAAKGFLTVDGAHTAESLRPQLMPSSRVGAGASRRVSDLSGHVGDDEEEDDDEGLSNDVHYAKAFQGDATFSFATSLSSLPQMNNLGVQALRRWLTGNPTVACLLPAAVVKMTLEFVESVVSGSSEGNDTWCELLSLTGLLVAPRGRVQEVLRYLQVLEKAQGPLSEGCFWVPQAREITDAFVLNTGVVNPLVSPLDCHQEQPQKLRVCLPEDVGVQCFCVGPDGQTLAVVTTRGISVFDLVSGSTIADRDFAETNNGNNSVNSSNIIGLSTHSTAPTPLHGASVSGASGNSNFRFYTVTFSSDGSHIIATHSSGRRHTVYSSDLVVKREYSTTFTAVSPDFVDGVLEAQPPPLLPRYHTSASLFFVDVTEPLFVSRTDLTVEPIEELVLLVHVHHDFSGCLVHLSCEDDALDVSLSHGTVKLRQADSTCCCIVSTGAKWIFLQVRWVRGVWSLVANSRTVELCGARSAQTKSVVVKQAKCLTGEGHVASLSLWSGAYDSRAAEVFARERRVPMGTKALVNLPLDEGMGRWAKETASLSCVTLSEEKCVWDAELPTPCRAPSAADFSQSLPAVGRARISPPRSRAASEPPLVVAVPTSDVRLEEKVLLDGRVMASGSQLLLLLPSVAKGRDDVVVVADRTTNTVVKAYRCPHSCWENMYALLSDESQLICFQPRFNTFSSVRLFSQCYLENKLYTSGLTQSPRLQEPLAYTASRLLEDIYKKVFLLSVDFYRVPPDSSCLSLPNLRRLTQLLAGAKPAESNLSVAALLALTHAHFQQLSNAKEDEVSRIATKLKEACGRISHTFKEPAILDAAARLLDAATQRSLTLQDKVNALLSNDAYKGAGVLRECTTKESLCAVIHHIAVGRAAELVGVLQRLLALSREETSVAAVVRGAGEAGPAPEATVDDGSLVVTRLLTWLILSSVAALKYEGRMDVIALLGECLADYAMEELTGTQSILQQPRSIQQRTALHTCCLPFFITVADLCPESVTPRMTEVLLTLLDELLRTKRPAAEPVNGDSERSDRSSRPGTVSFTTREACEVYPPDRDTQDRMWRLVLDFSRASTVSIHKEQTSPAFSVVRYDSVNQSQPILVDMTAKKTFAKLDGGSFFFFGPGESTFTTVAQFDFTVDDSWVSLLRDAVEHLLVSHATHLTRRSSASEAYVPTFMRYGLNSEALSRHRIDLPGRDAPSQLPHDILEDAGDGKEFVDQVLRDMRGSIVPSMRPAVQCILAILTYTGASMQQAEDELKLRWFSGEWGSKLQGANREATYHFLKDLANWVTHSLDYQSDPFNLATSVSLSALRRSSSEKRTDSSMNASRTISERRGSTSSRRSVVKSAPHFDTLDQVKTLLSRETTIGQLEALLAERTSTAMQMVRGLSVLLRLIGASSPSPSVRGSIGRRGEVPPVGLASGSSRSSAASDGMNERTLLHVLRVMWGFAGVESGTHYLDSLSGAGADLEGQVRSSFHTLVGRCSELLLGGGGRKNVAPQAVLAESAANGKATMLLLGILCHPWDVTDCEIFNATFKKDHENDLLQRLEGQMSIPTANLTLTSPWRLRKEERLEMSEGDERMVRLELLGAADLNSLSRIFPNDFSVVIPQVGTSRSESGVIVEKHSSSTVAIRADEGWPLTWRDGVPRVLYFEAKLNSEAAGVDVGLQLPKGDPGLNADLPFFYSSSGKTHLLKLPAYGVGDVVGCGVVTTSRRLFFTLNGTLLSFFPPVSDKYDVLFPALRFGEKSSVKVLVNFGTSAFAYDFRQLHPALDLRTGPTWYRIASTAAVALHYMTTRACAIQETRKQPARLMLTHCCEVVCRNVNKVTSSLMSLGVIGNPASHDSGTRIKQAVIFSVAEYSLMLLIATMRHVVNGGAFSGPLPDSVGEMLFESASILMLLPLHSVQISTISLLPEVIPHVRHVPDGAASASLVRTLFEHANGPSAETRDLIPFLPTWRDCDPRCMSIVNVQYACMVPEVQRSIVLGNVLPSTGVVSFSAKVTRRGMSKGHSLKGGYFIGVSVAGLSPLSPTSNSQSWKAAKPPIVWAIHDTSPQLPHATNPTVKPNNFQRTFGNDDVIRVVVDRDRRTIDFYRDDEFLKTLFSDLPPDAELVPFVQLYNEDATAVIRAGEMTAPISAPMLLSAASVDVLRAMLTLEPFQNLVAKGLCRELDTQSNPKVCLALFNSVPDPRLLLLRSGTGDGIFVHVSRVSDMRCKFSIGNEANYEHIYNLRTPAKPKITCSFDDVQPSMALDGLKRCVGRLIAALRRLVLPLITLQALSCLELEDRKSIVEEEKDRWDFLFHGVRVSAFEKIQAVSQDVAPVAIPRIPVDFTFSAALSHPKFSFSPNYCGRLATVPNGSKNAAPPFIAIAEPSVPNSGRFSIRCQLIRGHNGQILGGGYYFGLCLESFNWKRKELSGSVPEVWAFHDMDDAPWRLRHLYPTATFPIAAEPRCIVVSGDIIRLEVDRTEGTMHVFRKPMLGEEIALGLIYDNIPPNVRLYPFVHLFNVDAVAVLLPSNSAEPAVRLTAQQPHFALWPTNERRYCDGCAAAHSESRLTQYWYKCNECADYALCKSCFDLCVHSYHSFTEMGVPSFVHSSSPPKYLKRGMSVVVPGTSSIYLRSSGCRLQESEVNCVAEAIDDNAVAVWGMVCKGKGQFTVVVDTTDDEPLSTDSPMFIGVGSTEEIMQYSREKLRSKCFSGSPSIVCFSSDPTLRHRMDNESRVPYGFQKGSRVSVDVDLHTKTVSFLRDWVVVGTQPIQLPSGAGGLSPTVCCFVSFGRESAKVSVYPERGRFLTVTIDDRSGSIVRATVPGSDKVRFATVDNCRLPLTPCTSRPEINRLGYTFVNKQLTQCRVLAVQKYDVKVHCLQEDVARTIPLAQLLLTEEDAVVEEPRVPKDSKETGYSLETGFVMSRLLLVLSCMCEQETLSALVLAHSAELSSLARGLASVQIGNEAPLSFVDDIRNFIAATASCMRGGDSTLRLNAFIPTLTTDDRKRKFKPGVIVAKAEDAGGSKDGAGAWPSFYCVKSRNRETLRVEDIDTGASSDISYKQCIPVKQCVGRPWYTLDDGLPCSLLEHTRRLGDRSGPPERVPLDGKWEGEINFSRAQGTAIELAFFSTEMSAWQSDNSHSSSPNLQKQSVAVITDGQRRRVFAVLFAHARYGRTVRMCLVPMQHVALMRRLDEVKADTTMPFSEKIAQLILAAPYSLPDSVLAVQADLDAEGVRMNGVCRANDGRAGTFVANFTQRISFGPATTETGDVEPLPDCADAVIPAQPSRDVCATMHRLIVLLARHLYLVLCQKTQTVSKDFSDYIFLYYAHPLTDRLASQLVGAPNLYSMVCESCRLILDPGVRPWDAAWLSSLISKTFLLRSEARDSAPDSLLWDALHAVVVAAHRCGCYYRHEILRSIATFVQEKANAPATVYAQLFAALFAYVDRNVLVPSEALEMRKDIAAGVDLMLAVPVSAATVPESVPTTALRCLIDMWQSLRGASPLPAVVDTSAYCTADTTNTEEVAAQCAFGDFRDAELKVGKIMSSFAVGKRGKYYYEVVLPDRLNSPFAVGWGTEVHCDVPSQHVGSDRSSFSFNGTDMTTKEYKEEYKIPGVSEMMPHSVVGCLLDVDARVVAWSMNGARGPFIPIPILIGEGESLFAFASIGTCNGMGIHLRADQFEYAPDSYTDLSKRYTRVLTSAYDARLRSGLPVQSVNFYSQLASYLSDIEEFKEENRTQEQQAAVQSDEVNDSASARTASATAGVGGGGDVAAVGSALLSTGATAVSSESTLPSSASAAVTPFGTVTSGSGQTARHPSLSAQAAASIVSTLHVSVEDLFLPRYQALFKMTGEELDEHARVIAVIESCMATANRFVDLDGDTICGALSTAFVFLKQLVRRSFRRKLLVNTPGVEKVGNPPTIAIRITELYSTLPRTPEIALQHTVLSQLYKQIGSYSEAQWSCTPLFKVNLYISDSGHTPIDMGGPYRQVWTFLAEEVMRHPDKCFPHSDYHRNPLFTFVNNSQRVSLVPDGQANSSYELTLFNFFGKVMGHAARAQLPLDMDFSPFLWRFLVDDTLSVKDYYQHVDSVVETSMKSDNFLLSGIAEEIIPGFADQVMWAEARAFEGDDARAAARRRALAENCLVHSMDEQLRAIRSGLWSVLPRRVVRCLSWRDLEKLVCGETNPTVDDLKRYIRPQLQPSRESFFWQIVAEMSPEQKASLLCFASGQRRLPLIRPICVQENSESVDHLPRAQSCSSLITVPPYASYEVFREKLFLALQHQGEMELA